MDPTSLRCRAALLALGALLLRAPPAAAQIVGEPAPGLITGQFLHEDWRPEHGLPGRGVRALAQTRDGYLILGTDQSLARFDGVAFNTLPLAPAPAGPGAQIGVRALLEDSAGDLWVGTQRGLLRRRGASVTQYTTRDGLPDDLVGTLFEDARGILWVGTEAGLARRDGERFIPIPGLTQSAMSIGSDYRGDLWTVNHNAFLLRDGALVSLVLDERDSTVDARAIQLDPQGRLYVATLQDLLRYDPPALPGQAPPTRRFGHEDGLPDRPITRLLVDPAGRVWAGTSGAGLYVLSGDRFLRLSAREGLSDDNVQALAADREGDVLVGTGGGLAVLRPRSVLTHSESLPPLWSVCGGARDMWLGTLHGLMRISGPRRTHYSHAQGLPSDTVISCLLTEDGELLVGTRAGPARFADGRFVPLSPAVPPLGILAMLRDRAGDLWLGATGTLMRLHQGTLTTYTPKDGLPEGAIRVLREAPGGGILVGGRSLARAQDGVLREGGPYLGPIMDAAVDEQTGEVWITTYGRGLHLLRGGRYFHFEEAGPELPGALMRVLDDGRGALWISSEEGLVRVEKQALRDVADGRRRGLPVRRFDKLDGLLSTDFNASGQTSGWRGPDGRLWFPSTSGLLEIDPERLPTNPVPPLVHIDRVRADGVDLPAGDSLVLPAGTTQLEIRYTAPSLRMPRRARFRYRMEGVDAGWVDAGTGRSATYGGLRGGRYRFVVQAQNEDGVWSAADAAVTMRLPRPLSRRPWFLLLLVLGGALLFFGSNRALAHRHQVRSRRLEGIVEQRTAALQREIGERLRAQDALRRSRDELEDRVRERTAQLVSELAERSRLEQELLQSRKLEAVGRLAGGVAHDLNNMLTAIIGCAEFAREAATDETQREDIEGIHEAAERASQLTGRLLVFARRHVAAPRGFDPNILVGETSKLLRRVLGEHITIQLQPAVEPWPVWADPHQIEQVLVNLSINARDAMPGGGVLHVETRNVTIAPSERPQALAPGDYVLLVVTDEGTGMDAEVKRHLFEPFFTTKGPGRGTGLGLATCYGIVGQSGGHIEIESEPGRGTSVRVYLPRAQGLSEVEGPGDEAPAPRGSETVLLVEDMAEVRAITARALRGLGYRVVEAGSGEEALQLMTEGPPDVVVTDVVMPGMGGPEMAGRLQALWPGLRVLFTSGHLDRALSQHGVPDQDVPLLRKPFTAATLARRLREVITSPSRA